MCLVLHHGEQCWVVTLQQEAAWLRYVPTPFLTHAYYNKNTGTYMPPTMKWFHWWEQWQSWCSKCREVFVWHHACQIQLFVLTRGSAAYLAPSLSEVNSLTHSSIIFLAHYWKRHTHMNLSTSTFSASWCGHGRKKSCIAIMASMPTRQNKDWMIDLIGSVIHKG